MILKVEQAMNLINYSKQELKGLLIDISTQTGTKYLHVFLLLRFKEIIMIITKAEIVTLSIPMKEPFTVSFGTIHERIVLLVKLYTKDGLVGYGECASLHIPAYLPEFTGGERLVLIEFIIPSLLKRNIDSVEELIKNYTFIKGHNFAKAGVECAFWHILSQKEEKSLQELFGGTRDTIEVGESLGVKSSVEETIEEIQFGLEKGYKRFKIKIKLGWDLQLVKEIRKNFPTIPLMVDGNSDYSIDHIEYLKQLDQYHLMMIEQPLGYNDIIDHALLQKEIATPICLDESITNSEDTRKALFLKSCQIINIKPGRVGGPSETIKIHNYCKERNVPVWCGGLIETGIGRSFNVALASLENFTYPSDISETLRFFEEDVVDNPYTIMDGLIEVPNKAGLGFDINDKVIGKYTIDRQIIR